MASVNKRSPIWEHFKINSNNAKFAICMLCEVQISRGGEGKKAGTSAMKNHLKTKHPDKFQAIYKDMPTPLAAASTTNSSSTSSKQTTTEKQKLKQKLCWGTNDAKAKKYHYLIAEMIALDNEPLSIVERVGFTKLLEQALPRYKMPSQKYFSEKIIPDIYDRIYEKIKKHISGALAVSVTSHIWNCWHNNSTFLSFTAHWLSPDFELQHGVLSMEPLLNPHTGESIAKELNITAERWDIGQSKIHLLVHDSSANTVKAAREAEYDFARCFIHSLHTVVTESLKVQPEVVRMITTSRRLVTHFNHSDLAQLKLLMIQRELNLPEHQLVQDISTRWNSTYYMIERLSEQKRAMSLYVDDQDALTNLTRQQWCLIEQCIELLKPFEKITKIVSSNLSCISEVIPHVAALKKYLTEDDTEKNTPLLPHMRASLKAELESRFSSLDQDPNYLIATFLDPRFKTRYLSTVEAERARQKILLEFTNMSCEEASTSSSLSPTPAKRSREGETESIMTRKSHDMSADSFKNVANENNSSNNQSQEENMIAIEIESIVTDEAHDTSWDCNNKIANENNISQSKGQEKEVIAIEIDLTVTREDHDVSWDCFNKMENENNNSRKQTREKTAIVSEINKYLKAIRTNRNSDPYVWWSANATQYPNLSKFARIYLSAPCSSISNEKLFSEAGLAYEENRNRLLPVNAEKLLFIHQNLPLIQYEY